RFNVKNYSKISDINSAQLNFSGFENSLPTLFSTRSFQVFNTDLNSNSTDLFFENKPTASSLTPFSTGNQIVDSNVYSSGLTEKEKIEILNNHSLSFVLENYLNLLSGMNFTEDTFPLLDLADLNSLFRELVTPNMQPYQKAIQTALSQSPSDVNPYLKRIISPKVFDRVFNIIFDPDSFIVDNQKTNISIRNSMVQKGIIEEVSAPSLDGKTYYKNVEKSFRDPTLNSYFINIESYSIL
ncbi:MAG: hypothetical protein EBU90_11320, partial [Proteobacteria bacterium]|nr:hypothetical protein [Pseudomonadota bacterium]